MQYPSLARALCASLLALATSTSLLAQGPVPADFNGDGKSDLVWRNTQTGDNLVWFMDGATQIGTGALPAVPDLNWRLAAVVDLNGDGKPDLLWRNYATGDNVVWYLDGVNQIGSDALPPIADLHWALSGAGDFNGDGKPDLVWRNVQTGDNTIWLMNGASLQSSVSLDNVKDMKWVIAAVTDLNGDGKPDLLWRNFWTGQNGAWLMDGTSIIDNTDKVPKMDDPNWRITGNPYVRSDGKAGIVWRNYATGENVVWFLDWSDNSNPKMGDSSSLPIVTDTNWQIVAPAGFRNSEILSDNESKMLAWEATALGGGGFNAYDPSGISSSYTIHGQFVGSYPPRASASAIYQFRKTHLEAQNQAARDQLMVEVENPSFGGYQADDPETGKLALFGPSGDKYFVFTDNTWP
jgi:VCBS repeat protein